MSDINISVKEIKSVHEHPNADNLEIIKVLGTQTVEGKGKFKAGDKVVYFPPDMMIPGYISQELGVQRYLKYSDWDGEKIKCRIAACRLRGIPSYGFVIPAKSSAIIGIDLTSSFNGRQYVPPVKLISGDAAPDLVDFPRYTNIQHYWQYPDVIADGTPVRITEKLHGTNSRVGRIQLDDEWTFVAGSHNLRIKPTEDSSGSLLWHSRYWLPLKDANLQGMLRSLTCDDGDSAVVYGEIFGPGIQDMDYGLSRVGYRVYDIMCDGEFLDWSQVATFCEMYEIDTVPLLYTGPFSAEIVERYTCGPSTFDGIKSKFKGREGIVITPLTETWKPHMMGRTILKSVSADYLARKGAQDNE